MYGKLLKAGFILAMLLIPMVSLSMAACPIAKNDGVYAVLCDEVLTVNAPGILKNDVGDPGKTLNVVTSSVTMNPKYGTIEVNKDGSFVYNAAPNIASGTYVIVYYRATDGSCTSNQAYIKIQVTCTCHSKATNIIFCGVSQITAADLIAKGAGCIGCSDKTPVFDLSKVGTAPNTQYPYTVTCGCNQATGYVTFLSCSDNNICNGVETCDPIEGICVPGTPLSCNDNNVCNGAETCDAATGCVPGTPLTCNDNNACNGVETCDPVDGCKPGTPLTCDDNNVCNGVETCDPDTGCMPGTPLDCNDDGNICNGGETCDPVNGCVAGTPLTCNDNNVCTDDTCDAEDGCIYTPDDTNTCSDGIGCTTDVCSSGDCVSTPVDSKCNDNNQCTDDFCTPGIGCQHENKDEGTSCDLGIECSLDEYCEEDSTGVSWCLGHDERCAEIYDPTHCPEGNPGTPNYGYCNGYHCCTNPGVGYCVKDCGTDCPPVANGPQSGTCIT